MAYHITLSDINDETYSITKDTETGPKRVTCGLTLLQAKEVSAELNIWYNASYNILQASVEPKVSTVEIKHVKQSKLGSAIEVVANLTFGYFIALVCQMIVFPLYGIKIILTDNLEIVGIFTLVSLVRQYVFRRAFNHGIRNLLTTHIKYVGDTWNTLFVNAEDDAKKNEINKLMGYKNTIFIVLSVLMGSTIMQIFILIVSPVLDSLYNPLVVYNDSSALKISLGITLCIMFVLYAMVNKLQRKINSKRRNLYDEFN